MAGIRRGKRVYSYKRLSKKLSTRSRLRRGRLWAWDSLLHTKIVLTKMWQKLPTWARVIAVVVIASGVFCFGWRLYVNSHYALSVEAKQLVGEVNPTLVKRLHYDKKTNSYEFNQSGKSEQKEDTWLQNVGNGPVGYSLTLPTESAKKITFHDDNTKLAFSLKPVFDHWDGRMVDNHIVFPVSHGGQAIYTLKNNGLKEDIVFGSAPKTGLLSYEYQLDLPDTLVARPIEDGAIGIFSADASLYASDITYGGSSDWMKMEEARKTAPKNNLVFAFPAPTITMLSDACYSAMKNPQQSITVPELCQPQEAKRASARYSLSDNTLTVEATKLDTISGAFSLDPSVVVTNSSDFISGNPEDNIQFDSDQIHRGTLSGGATNSWQSTSALPLGRQGQQTVAYNDRLYIIGGSSVTSSGTTPMSGSSAIQKANVNSDGTLGSWQNAGTMPGVGYNTHFAATTYNGFLYLIGGDEGSGTSVYMARFGADGSLGPWENEPSLSAANNAASAVAYNGYVYVVGGGSTGETAPFTTSVYYAVVHADGSLGTWQSTSTLSTAIGMTQAISYNGYLYAVGGLSSGGAVNTAYYAKLNSDGSVGTWQSTTAFQTARYGHAAYAYRGYMYLAGGGGNNDMQYAQINANGSLETWKAGASYDTNAGKTYVSGAAYKDYLYVIGGKRTQDNYSSDEAQYAKVSAAGLITSYQSTTSLTAAPSALNANGAVVYNNCLYTFGGYYVSGSNQYSNKVYYASINTDGTLGSWTQSSNTMITAVSSFGLAINKGMVYIVGGYTGAANTDIVQYASFATSGCGVGTWTSNSNHYTAGAVANHSLVAVNNYLYAIGGSGSGSTTSVYSAAISSSNGSVGTWTAQTSLNTSRAEESLVAYGDYLYAIGGSNGGSNNITSVEYAAISSPGTLGSWTAASSLQTGRRQLGAQAYNGYLYAIGGGDGTTDVSSTEYAKINSDGTIDSWQYNTSLTDTASKFGMAWAADKTYIVNGKQSGSLSSSVKMFTINNGGSGAIGSWQTATTSLATARKGHCLVANNGYLYAIGGLDNTDTLLTSVEYAQLDSIGEPGSWSTTTALPIAQAYLGCVVHDGSLYIVGGQGGGQSGGQSVRYTTFNSNGTLGSWTSTTNLPAARYGHSAFAYNNYLYTVGGAVNAPNFLYDFEGGVLTPFTTSGYSNWATSLSRGKQWNV